MNMEESVQSAASSVKVLADEILHGLREKINNIQSKIHKMQAEHLLKRQKEINELSRLKNAVQMAEERKKGLDAKREAIKRALETDEKDIAKQNSQNKGLETLLRDLALHNKELVARKKEKESLLETLTSRYNVMRVKHEQKVARQLALNQNFKTYLGLNVCTIQEKNIRIVFKNLEVDCYIELDFENEDCVCACVPDLDLDRLNAAFKSEPSFYKFVKFVRNEIKAFIV